VGHEMVAEAIALTPDGKTLVSAGERTIRFWDFASLHPLADDALAKAEPPDGVTDDVPGETLVHAEARVERLLGSVLHFSVDDKPASATLDSKTRFLDLGGKPLPAAATGKPLRVGNIVRLKTTRPPKAIVLEARL